MCNSLTKYNRTNTFGNNYGEYYRGYFYASSTGDYTFYLASDDTSSIWISTTPNDVTNLAMIGFMGCCAAEYNYFQYQTLNPN